MDYSPWSEREIWPFLKVAISPEPEWRHLSKLVCMHNTLTSTCMNFFSRFQMIKFILIDCLSTEECCFQSSMRQEQLSCSLMDFNIYSVLFHLVLTSCFKLCSGMFRFFCITLSLLQASGECLKCPTIRQQADRVFITDLCVNTPS